MSLGTPQYMSPEQAMGEREITARSDVYALGAMTYEMLVGEPPFTGPTAQSIVAKVVTEHPRSLLPQRHTIPPHVDAAVLTALEKLPADRFATAAQFAEALARPGAVPLRTGSGPIHAASGRNARPAWVLPAAALLLVMAGFAAARPWRVPREGSAVALSVIPSPERLTGSYGENVAISPDGQTIAYIARGPVGRQIFIRRLDSFEAIPVAGTENVFVDPVFSPDGRSLAFAGLGGAEIYRVGITGGRPIRVADGGNCCTLLWTDQGIVYLANLGLMLNPLSGAEARLLAPAGFPGNAVLLPGGRALLNLSDQGGRHVEFIDLKSGKRSKVEGLPEAVEDLHYAEGYLFVQVGTDLWTAPLDPGNGRLTGEAVVLLPQVRTGATGGYRESQSAIAGNTIVFVPANGVNHLVLVSREGRESVIPDTVGSFHRPRFSPDGRRLLMDIARDADRDIWTYDFDQRTLSRLTFVPFAHDATWTPDGNRVLFEGNLQDTVTGIFSQRDDGSGVADTIFPAPGSNSPEALLPDGRILTYATAAATGADVWLVTPHQARPEVLLGTPFSETDLALSRDGRWLAWGSNESGTAEIYLRALAGGSRIRISTNGGTEPVWGRDGTELFYRERGTGGPLVVVRLSLSPLRVISRDTLFEAGQYEEADPHANYDYDPRTDRFIFVRPDMTNEIRLVRDWRALLKQP
jgi:serine/threonine-protein kinase